MCLTRPVSSIPLQTVEKVCGFGLCKSMYIHLYRHWQLNVEALIVYRNFDHKMGGSYISYRRECDILTYHPAKKNVWFAFDRSKASTK